MKLKYETLIEEKGINLADLPARAKIGIKSIKQWQAATHMSEKTGKKLNPDLLEKIQANDEWVCMEINNFLDGKKPSTKPLPNNEPTTAELEALKLENERKAADALAAQNAKNAANEGNKPDEQIIDGRGEDVDKELKVLLNAGKSVLTLQEIKDSAKSTYDILFDAYEVDGQNGIETSHFKLVETEKEVFSLSKK